MNKEKWMAFIHHLWATIGYWQLARYFNDNKLPGEFFNFTAYAVRDKLIMLIAHTVHLCEVIAKDFPVGDTAEAALEEIRKLYDQEYEGGRSTRLDYENCGISRRVPIAHRSAGQGNQLRNWQRSGLSVSTFCRRHGLAEGRFYAWRRILARRPSRIAAQ